MNPKTLFVILDQLLIEWDQKILLRQIALYRLMCPAGTGQVSPQRLIHSNPISLYLVNTFVFIIFIITLSYQQIHVRSYHYHFICSAHLCSFLSLSLYLVSTFMFILIIITLSFQKETQRWFFVQSRFNKQCKNTFCFPLNLLSWTANFNFSVHILVLKKVMIMAVELLFIFINDVDRDLVCP